MHRSETESAEPVYGWVMAGVALVMLAASYGSLNTIAVFLKPLVAEFGGLRGAAAFAYLVAGFFNGLCGIGAGYLADRYGTRRVSLCGAFFLGLSFVLLSRHTSMWAFYALHSLMGALGAAAINAPLIANVGGWFRRNKGLALSVAAVGPSLGIAALPYAAGALIVGLDWRAAYAALGVGLWLALIPLALLVRQPPQPAAGTAPRAVPGEPVETLPGQPGVTVPWVSIAAIFCCIAMATPLVHLVALASDRGLGLQTAAGVLAAMMVASVPGRLVAGRLADRLGGLRTYALSSFLQTATVFWFAQLASPAAFYAMAVVFGFVYSGVMTCLWICVREFAPAHRRALSQGVLAFLGWIGMGIGGWQGGYFFDLTGVYTLSYANAALAGVVNLVIVGGLYGYLARRRGSLPRGLASPTPAAAAGNP